jgi:drug/metabolite transporter (DMT)-like permease
MTWKTVLVLALMIVAGAAGDTLMSKGMKQVGEITSAQPLDLLRAGVRAARNPYVVSGVLGLAIYFFCFSAVLSWADVSLVVPISALSFLLTAFVAQRALGEHVTPQRWLGTVLIVLGVVLVARSSGRASAPVVNHERPGSSLEVAGVVGEQPGFGGGPGATTPGD